MSKKLSSEQKDKIYKRTSLKAETSIQSVARTVLFLLSEDAHSITGQVIHVDNGTI
jgi:3-oxoacyl-[acyl-carrier protein] reductase